MCQSALGHDSELTETSVRHYANYWIDVGQFQLILLILSHLSGTNFMVVAVTNIVPCEINVKQEMRVVVNSLISRFEKFHNDQQIESTYTSIHIHFRHFRLPKWY